MFVKGLYRSLIIFQTFVTLANGGVGEWKNYTAMKYVRGIGSEGRHIWAATSGGLFSFDTSDSTFQKITNIEGLRAVDLSALAVDNRGRIWTGALNGSIDVYSPATHTWQHISDIETAIGKTQKGIFKFYFVGDSAYIATDFGVSVFSTNRFEFKDTYAKLGAFPSPIRANSVVISAGRIWIATPNGIASASVQNANLAEPSAWTNHQLSGVVSSNYVNALGIFGGKLYAGTNAGLLVLSGTVWEKVSGEFQDAQIIDIGYDASGNFFVATARTLYQMSGDGTLKRVGNDLSFPITCILPLGRDVWLGLDGGGVARWNESSTKWEMEFPNSPNSNLFVSVAVDENGVLWAASGKDGGGRGFYSFDGSTWANFSAETQPLLKTNDYHKVSIGCNNAKWVSSWGYGIVLVKNDGTLTRFDSRNSGLAGIPNDPNWVVVGGAACDNKGRVWMINYMNSRNFTFAVVDSSSTWTDYRNILIQKVSQFADVVIDPLGTKWFTPYLPAPPEQSGLFFFNESLNLPNTSSGWGFVGKDDGLESSNVTTVSVDRNGDIWVGTDVGVNIIPDPRNPKRGILPACLSTRCNISGQYVNTIAVDAINNKWIGTKTSGVWVLSQDGTTLLAQYNASNSPLLDNDIKSIAFDDNKGIVYFGTDKGLSSLQTVFVAPQQTFGTLSISPNPFTIPSTSSLSIDGLVEASSVKVLSVDGKVIKEFVSPGGRICFWDGTDSRGKLVPSGIYIIVAYSEDGSQITKGKVAVLRR
jgi:ligand-binding sensor domain-containing protein